MQTRPPRRRRLFAPHNELRTIDGEVDTISLASARATILKMMAGSTHSVVSVAFLNEISNFDHTVPSTTVGNLSAGEWSVIKAFFGLKYDLEVKSMCDSHFKHTLI